MIGNGHHRTGAGNPGNVRGGEVNLHVEFVQQIAHEIRTARALVKIFQLVDTQKPVHCSSQRPGQSVRRERFKCH